MSKKRSESSNWLPDAGKALATPEAPARAAKAASTRPRTVLFRVRENATQKIVRKVIKDASRIMGSEDIAMRWLGTPVRALDFATPISLLGSEKGVERVCDVLGQMEHGIW